MKTRINHQQMINNQSLFSPDSLKMSVHVTKVLEAYSVILFLSYSFAYLTIFNSYILHYYFNDRVFALPKIGFQYFILSLGHS